MDGMNEVQINCQLSIFHVCNASTWHCDCVMYVIKDVTEQITTELWIVRE